MGFELGIRQHTTKEEKIARSKGLNGHQGARDPAPALVSTFQSPGSNMQRKRRLNDDGKIIAQGMELEELVSNSIHG